MNEVKMSETNEMHRARLIPVSGISSAKEAEQRATSALLAVISIVRPFSEALTAPLGASRAKRATVETYTEVEVKLSDGQKVRPDGLIKVSYGSNAWTALVEVKTGDANLRAEQINNYLQAAKVLKADAVITISNEIGVAGTHPTEGLNVRSNSKIKVHHFSWMRLLSIASKEQAHSGVDDPEQAWILKELIRYLEHPSSGASALSDMGPSWVAVRNGARDRSLKKGSTEISDISGRWDHVIRQVALRLTSETGVDVSQQLSRSQKDPKARTAFLCESLVESGQVSADLRVPGSAGDIEVTGDLRSMQIVVSTTIDAPSGKKRRGSVAWLTRQLRDASPTLTVEAFAPHARTPIVATLGELLEDPSVILAGGLDDISKFRVVGRCEAGKNGRNGSKKPGFITTVDRSVHSFYLTVLEQITPWVAPVPKVVRPQSSDTAPQPTAETLADRTEFTANHQAPRSTSIAPVVERIREGSMN